MKVDPAQVEEIARELYVRALKILPPDVKEGFARLAATERDATAKGVLGTMITNIRVAEETENLLCQATGIPIYNVTIGRGVEIAGVDLERAIRRGCERATREHSLRSSVVHPITRRNEHTSCGPGVPAIHFGFCDTEKLVIEMIPKGSGSENNSWLRMAIPADGVNAIKAFVVDCVIEAGGKTCPPTIVGVGVGGTSDMCMALAKRVAPEVSVGTAIFAAVFLDAIWPVLVLAGVERVAIVPGITRVVPLDFIYYPWSHSLVAAIFWGAVFGGAYWLIRRNARNAVWLGALVVSHWGLDWISHRPDLPLYPGEPRAHGLELWASLPPPLAVGFAVFLGRAPPCCMGP